MKVAEVNPPATVTVAGTVSAELPEDSTTAEPPEDAAVLRVTVQVLDAPAATLAGEHCSADIRTGATRVSVAICDPPFREAVISAV